MIGLIALVAGSRHRGVVSASALARGPAGAGPRRRGNGPRNRSRRLDAPDPGDVPGHRARRHRWASRSGQLAARPCPWSAPSWAGSWPSCWREPWPARRSRRRCWDARGVGGSMACSTPRLCGNARRRGSCRGFPPQACTTPPASHPSGRERSRERSRSVRWCGRLPYAVLGRRHRLRVARNDRDCGGLHRAWRPRRGIAHAPPARAGTRVSERICRVK